MDGSRLLKAAFPVTAGALAAPAIVRRLDRRRAAARGEKPPSLPVGEVVEGIRSRDGTRLFVDCCGEGDTTVFMVHGWTCNGTVFRYQKAHLCGRYRVVTLDLRGYGRSDMPHSLDMSIDRLAEDLKAVVDHFAPQRFVVAGHSMGGFTAFKFHERFGEEYRGRLKGLVIIDSTGTALVDAVFMGRLVDLVYPVPLEAGLKFLGRGMPLVQAAADLFAPTPFAYMLVRWAAFGRKPLADEVEFQREMTFATSVQAMTLGVKAILDYDVQDHLPHVDVPVLVLVGSLDKLTSARANRRTCEMLPRARLVVFEGAGHSTMLERTDELNRELDGFLAECLGAATGG